MRQHQLRASEECLKLLAKVERVYGIPTHLLKAIALTESGRTTGTRFVPWPWTINVNGKGYFFTSKAEAIRATRQFQKQGLRSIDVGCMQINLLHHPEAFNSLEEAFDPATNIRYGAEFLVRLRESQRGGWPQAVGHYHSGNPSIHGPYKQKVIKIWQANRSKTEIPFQQRKIPLWQTSFQKRHSTPLPLRATGETRREQREPLPSIATAPIPAASETKEEMRRIPSLKSLKALGTALLYTSQEARTTTTNRIRRIKNNLRISPKRLPNGGHEPLVKRVPPLRASYQTHDPHLRPPAPIFASQSLRSFG